MFKKLLSLSIVLVALAALSGCSSGAKSSAMTVPAGAIAADTDNSSYKNSIATVLVSGGSDTNAAWVSKVSNSEFKIALEQSLAANSFMGDGSAPHKVDARLIKLQQPIFGFAMTVTSTVRYRVYDADGEVTFDETIVNPFTASFGSSLVANRRLRLANEGSVKGNITKFISQLARK